MFYAHAKERTFTIELFTIELFIIELFTNELSVSWTECLVCLSQDLCNQVSMIALITSNQDAGIYKQI